MKNINGVSKLVEIKDARSVTKVDLEEGNFQNSCDGQDGGDHGDG